MVTYTGQYITVIVWLITILDKNLFSYNLFTLKSYFLFNADMMAA